MFAAETNPMGITEFSFIFGDSYCDFRYKNAQGDKCLRLGRNENCFGLFPQTGYSRFVGGKKEEGHRYQCASSFAWGTDNQMNAQIQIIDDYIGNLHMSFSYRDSRARIRMEADAENFLGEYNGVLNAFA